MYFGCKYAIDNLKCVTNNKIMLFVDQKQEQQMEHDVC